MRIAKKLMAFALILACLTSSLLPVYIGTASADGANLIPNPSVESAATATPQNWTQNSWGANTSAFSYENTGRTGSRSVKVQTTAYASGDAKWYFAPVAVTPGASYVYGDYYQATVATDIVAQYDDGLGNYSYAWLGNAVPSAAWKQSSYTFVVPAGTKQMTIFHLLAGVGSLTTDDFSLVAAATPPVTPAADGANLIPNPSVESAATATPQNWTQNSWGANTSAFSYENTGRTGSRSVKVQTTAYASGDAKWYFAPVAVQGGTEYTYSDYYQSGVQSGVVAQIDDGTGNYAYQEIGTAPASTAWKQFTATFVLPVSAKTVTIFHLLAGVGSLTTDDFSLVAAATPPVSTVPTVMITAPTSNASVSKIVALAAAATFHRDNTIRSVQLRVDGVSVGPAFTAAPYTYNWDSASVPDGVHDVSAVATAADGQVATSAPVSFRVANTQVAPMNLVPNASVETASPSDPASPQGWYKGQWGANTSRFTYETTGHTGSHSVGIQMAGFGSGGANWTYDAQPVTGGKAYDFTHYYQSNVKTDVLAAVKLSDGTTQYLWLGSPYISDGTWSRFYATFTAPTRAISVVVYQSIAANGYFKADDFNLKPYAPQGFNNPMVTVTFDDTIVAQYTNGFPIMQKYGFKGTYYAITSDIGVCDRSISSVCYMTKDQLLDLYRSGMDIGSHSETHPNLTGISTADLSRELGQSKATLELWLGAPVQNIASPYGAVNATVLSAMRNHYTSHRGVQTGYNSIDNYDRTNLMVQDINSSTTVAQVQGYIDFAKATNTWLILMYHDINADLSADRGYNTTPADFDAHMSYLKSSAVPVVTMTQGLQAVYAQIGK